MRDDWVTRPISNIWALCECAPTNWPPQFSHTSFMWNPLTTPITIWRFFTGHLLNGFRVQSFRPLTIYWNFEWKTYTQQVIPFYFLFNPRALLLFYFPHRLTLENELFFWMAEVLCWSQGLSTCFNVLTGLQERKSKSKFPEKKNGNSIYVLCAVSRSSQNKSFPSI